MYRFGNSLLTKKIVDNTIYTDTVNYNNKYAIRFHLNNKHIIVQDDLDQIQLQYMITQFNTQIEEIKNLKNSNKE